jgi:hypothetical protein
VAQLAIVLQSVPENPSEHVKQVPSALYTLQLTTKVLHFITATPYTLAITVEAPALHY